MILAGDIGGTNARLCLFEKGKVVEEKIFPSRERASLEEIAIQFLGSRKVKSACFGIAGAIHNGICKATNLPWVVSEKKLSAALQIPQVHLLNDLEANAYGIPHLKANELVVLQKGVEQQGHRALIAAGTGLGEAGIFWDGKKHRPMPSEGGHADFAPRNNEEMKLFEELKGKFGHVSWERVVSGHGLENLYSFLEKKERTGKEIIQNKDKEARCAQVIEWFISLYGAEAGNIALKFLPVGGLYLGGGIAPRLIEELKKGSFVAAMVNKGRFRDLLMSIPVKVIMNDMTALLGAAAFAESMHAP